MTEIKPDLEEIMMKADAELLECIEWVRTMWGRSYLGHGSADRHDWLKNYYGEILAKANLEVYFVRTGENMTMASLFEGRAKGHHDVRVIA